MAIVVDFHILPGDREEASHRIGHIRIWRVHRDDGEDTDESASFQYELVFDQGATGLEHGHVMNPCVMLGGYVEAFDTTKPAAVVRLASAALGAVEEWTA